MNFHESWRPVLERHQELPPHVLSQPEHKESLRQAVREHVEQAKQNISTAAPPQAYPVSEPQTTVHEESLMKMDADRQVEFLAHMAIEQGIEPAVKLANNLDSPYVLDALHDFIADKILEALLRKHRFV